MAKKTNNTQAQMAALQSKERKQNHWVIAGGCAILLLLLLLTGMMGFATNWWQMPKTTPFALTGETSSGATPAGEATTTGASNDATRSTSSNGSNSSTTTTTKETTTNNTVTPAPTPTPTPQPTTPSGGILETILADAQLGKNINELIDEAQGLGAAVNCQVEFLVVQVCDFSANGSTVTTKNLLSSPAITGVTSNLGL